MNGTDEGNPAPPAQGFRAGCPPPAIRRWRRVLLPIRDHPHPRRRCSRAASILYSASMTQGGASSRRQPSSARGRSAPERRSRETCARRPLELSVSERPMNEPLVHRAGEAEVVFLPELECPGEGKPGARGSFFGEVTLAMQVLVACTPRFRRSFASFGGHAQPDPSRWTALMDPPRSARADALWFYRRA